MYDDKAYSRPLILSTQLEVFLLECIYTSILENRVVDQILKMLFFFRHQKSSKYGCRYDVNELLFTLFFIGGIMIGLVTVFNITKPFLHFN